MTSLNDPHRGSGLWETYAARLGRNAAANVLSLGTIRPVAGGILVLVAIGVIRTFGADTPDRVAEAWDNVRLTVAGTLAVGALALLVNFLLAPWRLDRALRVGLAAQRAISAADLASIEAERDEAREALERHLAATAVSVDVRIVARDSLAAVDVGDASIEAWLDQEEAALGGPPPQPPPRPEPALGSGLAATAEVIRALSANAGAFGVLRNAIEQRTPPQHRQEIAQWLAAARAGAREELLRLGLMAHVATVQVIAENTGRRHLSEVRVTLRFLVGGLAQSAYETTRSSSLPERPRPWAEPAYVRSAFLGIDRSYDPTVRAYEGADEVVVELGPSTVPPGNAEQIGSLVLAIPRPPAGTTIEGTWRVTAREAEGDSTGGFRLDVGPDTLGHDELRKATETYLDRGS